jgi:hypothetical protein
MSYFPLKSRKGNFGQRYYRQGRNFESSFSSNGERGIELGTVSENKPLIQATEADNTVGATEDLGVELTNSERVANNLIANESKLALEEDGVDGADFLGELAPDGFSLLNYSRGWSSGYTAVTGSYSGANAAEASSIGSSLIDAAETAGTVSAEVALEDTAIGAAATGNPIGLAIGTAIGLGLGAYQIYKTLDKSAPEPEPVVTVTDPNVNNARNNWQ